MNEAEQREFDEAHKNMDLIGAVRAKALPLPWTTTEGEFVLYTDHKTSLTADDVIRDQVENWYADGWAHRAVWHGYDLVAVLRPDPAGGPLPEVVRLDGPEPVVVRPAAGGRGRGRRSARKK